MTTRASLFGTPLAFPRSRTTQLLVEPTSGFNASQPPTDLQPGQTPDSVNWIMRDGALEPRSRLSIVGTNENPLAVAVTGGLETVSSVGTVYPLISAVTRWAWYSQGSWSGLSYVGSFVPSGATTDSYTFTQVYEPASDEMLAIGASSSYQTLLCWLVGSRTTMSTVTQAPRARYVTTFDNFVLAANIRDVGSAQTRYVQRVQWGDRGNPFNWTSEIAGHEDLLAGTGEITGIFDLDNRVVVFFEGEVWVGRRTTGVASFAFEPLDRTVGTRYGRTVAKTPLGLCFLGNDFMVYLLPKEGGPPQPIGKATQRHLREQMGSPERAHAAYDERVPAYRLFYPTRTAGQPTKELVFNLTEGSYAPQDYGAREITRAFPAYSQNATAAISYDDLTTAEWTYNTIPYTFDQMGSSSTRVNRTLFLGSSTGTVYHLSSTETRDDGTPVEARWRSSAMGGDTPDHQKAITQVRVDVKSTVASSLTVRASRNQGATFDAGQQLTVPASDAQAPVVAWMQTSATYPMVELTTEDIGVRVYRLWLTMRAGGR